MDVLAQLLDWVLHPVDLIRPFLANPWMVYPILWALVALESYFMLFAWLPAETSMFLAGSLAAQDDVPLNLFILMIGYLPFVYFGWQFKYQFGVRHDLPSDKFDDTLTLFQNHACLATVFGRFIPIVGIFLPIVAGEAAYEQRRFKLYNLIGTFVWVIGSTVLGFYLGRVTFFKEHFTLLILLIIIVPAGIYYVLTFLKSFAIHH